MIGRYLTHLSPLAKRVFVCELLLIAFTVTASARCGSTDYTWGSQSLYDMCLFIVSIMNVITHLLNVIAVLLGLYAGTTIYIKMEMGEEGFGKSVAMLIGSFIFLMAEMIVFPSFFGIVYGDGDYNNNSQSFFERFLSGLFG